MGLLFRLIRWLLHCAIYLVLVILIITLIPNLPPYTKFSSIELEPLQPREGPLKMNGALNNAQKLYKDKLWGPEGLELYNGEVYTSLGSGEVVKLSPGGHVTFVTKLGQPCEAPFLQHKCGRPLGLAIDEKKGQMYVADSYYGIWKVNIKTDKKQLLVSPRVEIEGRKPVLFNCVALSKNGDLYWTDSTSDFPLHKGLKSMLADPSGRLFHYNPATNSSKVLLDDLWFANGVVASPDNQFVVVADSGRYRLVKYYVSGPHKGKSEVLLAGLPGVPDNLKALPDGSGFLVAMYLVFDEDEPFVARSLAQTPVVRKFLARMLDMAELPFRLFNTYFPNPTIERIAYSIGSFPSLSALVPKKSGLLVVDWSGNIVEAYYNTDGSLSHISDAIVYQDKLLTGSPDLQEYVGAVPAPPLLKKAFAGVKSTPSQKTAQTVTKPVPKQDKPKVEEEVLAKPVKAPKPAEKTPPTPKPTTTTTPKPTTTTTPKPTTTTTPKPTTTTTPKPTTTATPKPTTTATPKPTTTTTPKPTTTTTPKPTTTTTPKPTTTTTPKPTTTTTTTSKPATTTTAKPVTTTTSTPKPTTTPPKTAPQRKDQQSTGPTTKPTPSPTPKKSETKKPVEAKPVPQQIPIEEEISSDTVKPTKEKLRVITKGGPREIPNPEL